jgi:hypothetical protein
MTTFTSINSRTCSLREAYVARLIAYLPLQEPLSEEKEAPTLDPQWQRP